MRFNDERKVYVAAVLLAILAFLLGASLLVIVGYIVAVLIAIRLIYR